MASALQRQANVRLPQEVNRILFVKNLCDAVSTEEMYEIFGKYGPIKQIRVGTTRGTAFVVYDDMYDAKNACKVWSGLNVINRYLVVNFHNYNKVYKLNNETDKEEIDALKKKYGMSSVDFRK